MKLLFTCLLCLGATINLYSDSTYLNADEKFSFEKRWEIKKRRLDSALKKTDAIMDSLTGKSKSIQDTLALLRNYELRKNREVKNQIELFTKIGGAALFGILVIVALLFRKKWMG